MTGGAPTELLHQLAWSPRVSPDGVRLFVGKDPPTATICRVASCHGGRDFTLPNPLPATVQWTPDGKALIYLIEHDGVTALIKRTLAGAAPREIVTFAGDELFDFGYSFDGQSLAVTRGAWQHDIVLISGLSAIR